MIDNLQRILVVKLADLGDVLVCEPAIRSLRTAYPDAAIDILVPPTSAGVIELIGHGTTTETFPKYVFDQISSFARPGNLACAASFARRLRHRSYDAVIILHHLTTSVGTVKFRALAAATGAQIIAGLDNGRGTFLTHRAIDRGFGARHEADYMLAVARAVGGSDVDPRPRVNLLNAPPVDNLPAQYVVLFPATGPYSSARTWPAGRFAEVARALQPIGLDIVIVGGEDASDAARTIRRAAPHAIDLTGRTTLSELARIVRGAAVTIGGDSFIGHLAGALDRPVVSIFGPSNAPAWKPYGSAALDEPDSASARGIVVRHDLPCEPCIYTGYSLGRRAGCPARTCLTMVATDDVVNAARIVIGAN